MKQYKKQNHTIYPHTGQITTELGTIINPTEEQLIAAGYELIEPTATEHIPELTAAQRRKEAYATEPIVDWEGEMLTIDEVNALYGAYLAEGDADKSAAISKLIASAKSVIRGR